MRIRDIIEEYHPLVSVQANSPLQVATSKMLVNDFSQLAVIENDEKVIGFISWRTIGVAGNFNPKKELVEDYMDSNVLIVKDSERVFEYIDKILEKEFAFISNKEEQVYTILTLFDLSLLFKLELEPFLELKAIEKILREYISTNLDENQFLEFCKKKINKHIKSPNDLTFGQYLTILKEETFWQEFQIPLHKETFIEKLDTIRLIRNKIMHFKTHKLSKQDLKHLMDINKFFRVQNAIKRK